MRRAEIDWLRVLAFGALVPLHAAIPFVPGGLPLIQNDRTSAVLNIAVLWLHEFRLPLLFLVAGMGMAFSLRRRSGGGFLAERVRRLLIPLLVGILVVVPPMVYLEYRFTGAIRPGFIDFYRGLFNTGIYPRGNLSWHHYWFVAYLFLFAVAALPVVQFLRHPRRRRWMTTARVVILWGPMIYAPIVPLAAAEILLRARFPGVPDLLHDWANIVLWFQVMMLGLAFAAWPALFARAERLRLPSLILAIDLSQVLYWVYVAPMEHPLRLDSMPAWQYLMLCMLRAANIWCWLLAITGYASRHFRRDSALLRYLNRAVFPLFCLHLPVAVAASYWVVGTAWPLWPKYLFVLATSLLIPLAVYHWLLRTVPPLGLLFGLAPHRKPTPLRKHP
ncbi:MAG: acyltransferase family protein [Gammaproteobacteria bacterium]